MPTEREGGRGNKKGQAGDMNRGEIEDRYKHTLRRIKDELGRAHFQLKGCANLPFAS